MDMAEDEHESAYIAASVSKNLCNASKTSKEEERSQGNCRGNSSQEGGGEISWPSVPREG